MISSIQPLGCFCLCSGNRCLNFILVAPQPSPDECIPSTRWRVCACARAPCAWNEEDAHLQGVFMSTLSDFTDINGGVEVQAETLKRGPGRQPGASLYTRKRLSPSLS